MLEKSQKNTLLGLQWDHNWNCQEVWSSYLHFSKHSRWSIPGGGRFGPPPVLIGLSFEWWKLKRCKSYYFRQSKRFSNSKYEFSLKGRNVVYGCPLSRGMGEGKPNCSSQLLNYCTFCTCQLNEALYCVCQLQKGTISYLHTFILYFSSFFLDSLIQCLVFWEPHPNRNINYRRKIPPMMI